ncbi:MAG: TlpA family protein disulfide reductase [Rhodospirillales bacterium]
MTPRWSIMALSAALFVSALTLASGPAAAEKGVEGFAIHDAPMPVPELAFQRGDGSPVTLKEFRGRVVLLNIWATWCVPCRREMPTLDRLQAKLGGAGFEVVALSIDRAGVEVVKKFYEEIGIKNLALYIDTTGKATRALKVVGLPTTLLIDAAGREVGRLVGPSEWDAPEMVSFLRKHVKETRRLGSVDPASTAAKP